MQITLQNTEKGQCYAVRFDRYRQQVVDKLKTAVSVRWWDKSTGAWMIPAKFRLPNIHIESDYACGGEFTERETECII